MLFAPVLGKRFFALETRRDFFLKESAGSFRSQREEFFIKRDTNTLLASPHAELPGEFDLIFSVVFCDQALEFFNNFSRAFQMTARSNADGDFHRESPPSNHEEEGVLSALSPFHGNGETRSQADAVADVGPEHPGTGLAHLGFGLIDHGAKEKIRNTIKDLGYRHQGADDAGVQAYSVRQVDHDEEGQERPNYVASNVTRTITYFVYPIQISLFVHCSFSSRALRFCVVTVPWKDKP